MNILLTSPGRRSYIVDYFKKCNGIDKVFTANCIYTIALQRADGYLITPIIYDPKYIPSIISYCKENNIGAVLSLFDVDLLVLAKHEQEFAKNNIQLILAPAEFVEVCNDKYKTYKFCVENGLPTPKTYLHVDEVIEAVSNHELSYPIMIKPRWGMASLDIYKVENEEELLVLSKKCQRDIFKSYLRFESAMTPDEAIVYQEVVCGEEYGLDVINDLKCNYVETFAKQKVTMRSGETDLGRTASNKPFVEIAKAIAAKSGHKGILSVDCFKTDKGVYVIEMNCRISGHYPLAYLAGFNYPQLLTDWLNGKETDRNLLQFKEDLYIIKDLVPTILNRSER